MALGLGISAWLFIRGVQEVEFSKVPAETGAYAWHDANRNGLVDFKNPAEFQADNHGNYIRETAGDIFGRIEWDSHLLWWLFLAIVAMFGRDLGYVMRIRILTHKRLTWRRSLVVIMLWEFASALTPGVLSGATVAMFILNREKIELGRSTAIVIVTSFLDNLFYVLLIPLVFLSVASSQLFPSSSAGDVAAKVAFWTGFGFFTCLCIVLYLSIFQFPNLLKSLLGGITRIPFLRRFREGALRTGEDVALTARQMKRESFGFWLKSFGATVLSWTSRYLVINCILQAFLHLGLFDHLLILAKQLVLWMFLRISPTPGGSGVAEFAFAELLSAFAESAVLLAGMALLWRLISYFPYLVIGSVLLPRWLGRKK